MVTDTLTDAKLFRLDQVPSFMESLQTYRDRRLMVQFVGGLELQLSKPSKTDANQRTGDLPYNVSGVRYSAETEFTQGFVFFLMSNLFDKRDVEVKVYDNPDAGRFFPMDNLGLDDFNRKLTGYITGKRGPSKEVKGTLLHTSRIWRFNQLPEYSRLINSYRDKTLEVKLSSNADNAIFKLEKLKAPHGCYEGDQPYQVTGIGPVKEEQMYRHIEQIFSNPPVSVQISNEKNESAWQPRKPMKLSECVRALARNYNDY